MGNCSPSKNITYDREDQTEEIDQENQETKKEYLSLPYFWSELSRDQAEDVLRRYANNPGTFLIRYSSEYGKLALTTVVSLNMIGSAIIYSHFNNFYLEQSLKFPTLDSLVKHYQHVDLPNKSNAYFNSRLGTPLMKNRPPAPRPYEEIDVEENTEANLYYSRMHQHIHDYRDRMGLSNPRPAPRNNEPQFTRLINEDNGVIVAMRTPPVPKRRRHKDRTNPDNTVPKQINDGYLDMNPQTDLIRFSRSSMDENLYSNFGS